MNKLNIVVVKLIFLPNIQHFINISITFTLLMLKGSGAYVAFTLIFISFEAFEELKKQK